MPVVVLAHDRATEIILVLETEVFLVRTPADSGDNSRHQRVAIPCVIGSVA